MNEMIPTGKDLRRLRELAGLTQSELARRIGVSQSFIAKIESGKIDPKISIVKKIMDELMNTIEINEIVKKVMTTPVIVVNEDEDIKNIVDKMEKYGISQLPVVDKEGKVKGMIYDFILLRKILKGSSKPLKAKDVMSDLPPLVTEDKPISIVSQILTTYPAVLVIDDKLKPIGIVTRSDLLRYLVKYSEGALMGGQRGKITEETPASKPRETA